MQTVITIDDEFTSISEIPFPTITLCDPIKVTPSILDYSGIKQQMVESNYTDFIPLNVIQQMYSASPYCRDDIVLQYIEQNNITIDRSAERYLEYTSLDMFTSSGCTINPPQMIDCKKMFTKVISDEGICYTFNHLSFEEIYRDKVLADEFPKLKPFFIEETNTTYPFYVRKSVSGFFQILMQFPYEREMDSNCNAPGDNEYLSISIHSADDQFETQKLVIPLGHIYKIRVRPKKISTDQNFLNTMSIAERKCVDLAKASENTLTFFRRYSQQNCFYEKLLLYMDNECGCAYFWMPRRNETRLCNASDAECWFKVRTMFINVDSSTEQCFPACGSLSYDSTMTAVKPDKFQVMIQIENETYYDIPSFVNIIIEFDNYQYLFMKRTALYAKFDVYAACAGFISLFLGLSFVSIGKTFYSVTLRPFLHRRKGQTSTKKIRRISNPLKSDAIKKNTNSNTI